MRITTPVIVAFTTLVTILGVALGHFVAGYPLIGIDDANIFLTYAQNLTRGWGFVYTQPGQRVEGFTSLAWVLICALATRFSGRRELVLLTINVGLVVLSLVSLVLFVRGQLARSGGAAARHAGCYALLVLPWSFLGPDYVIWMTLTLMDTALWATVFTLGALATALTVSPETAPRYQTTWLAVIGSVALVTRPESMLLVPLWISLGAIATYALTGDIAGALRRYAGPAAICALTLALLVGFRLAYFGYPLPNTYYAKVSPSLLYNVGKGTIYFSRFVLRHALVAPCLACAVVTILPLWGRLMRPLRDRTPRAAEVARIRLAVVSLIVIIGIILPVLSGGDHFVQFRFYQPLWPLLIVPPLGLSSAIISRRRSPYVSEPMVLQTAGCSLLGLGLAIGLYASHRPAWHGLITERDRTISHEFDIARTGRTTGALLNQTLGEPPGFSIGVVAAGGIAVTFHGETIDLMGLNDLEMGHSAGDRQGRKNHAAFNPDVFYKQSPDLVCR
jgi:arabinofuranosyltransferase